VAGVVVSNNGTFKLEQDGILTVNSMLITGVSATVIATNVAMLTISNDLTVAASGRLFIHAPSTANSTNASCTVTVGGTLLVSSNGTVFPVSNPTNGGSAFIHVRDLVVERGGWINANSNGYAGGWGIGAGTTRGGGGHGGNGGTTGGGVEPGGGTYGNSNAPVQPGSGGGSYAGGRPGGGVIWVLADGRVTVDGSVTANGANGQHDIGSGAGGSIYIRCRGFHGSGLYEARGGDTTMTSGGGGGGRIAIYRVSDSFTGMLSTNSVRGGTNSTTAGSSGYVGTLVLEKTPAPGTVILFR
jgi:hypothetical protein